MGDKEDIRHQLKDVVPVWRNMQDTYHLSVLVFVSNKFYVGFLNNDYFDLTKRMTTNCILE